MNLENLKAGAFVRYPRTGTSGTITRLVDKNGRRFAELDSTGLLYRLDQLIPAESVQKNEREIDRDEQLARLEQERSQVEKEAMEEPPNLDGACAGAG
ncbi:DUF2098 domain-containing protein [Methanospirillum hungatei]|uniref:DUF2098 domain-containing protein n=1 Tax=Methanospirillum hungatei TaxID=2203 RepID=UPI0026E98191|nr:DUF2098 domain-containing protein [Methanospirillum hungatei]MCA1916164.1 DUF2098 domain-containing protein [Methanospirillum hungatei]